MKYTNVGKNVVCVCGISNNLFDFLVKSTIFTYIKKKGNEPEFLGDSFFFFFFFL